MQKTIFITGASAGLGKAAAILFQRNGWEVIATMRDPDNETELTRLENVIVLPLDVSDPEQISGTVNKVLALHDVDVVFNNAGYGLIGVLESLTDEQIMKQINTNILGVLRVTKAFIPYFREKKSGLFISTTSIGGLFGFPLGSVYHATKFALEGWSESLSHELSLFNIGVKTIAPGGIITDFGGRSLDTGAHTAYQEIEEKMFGSFDDLMKSASTAAQIAEVVYGAATDGRDQVRYVAGSDAKTLYERRLEIGNEAFRLEIRKQILGQDISA